MNSGINHNVDYNDLYIQIVEALKLVYGSNCDLGDYLDEYIYNIECSYNYIKVWLKSDTYHHRIFLFLDVLDFDDEISTLDFTIHNVVDHSFVRCLGIENLTLANSIWHYLRIFRDGYIITLDINNGKIIKESDCVCSFCEYNNEYDDDNSIDDDYVCYRGEQRTEVEYEFDSFCVNNIEHILFSNICTLLF
uniref:Uncharacterized protein n=1 Tax=Pithovirus LCDPAC02 TaxID=2506601 RepID=A0A481YQC4_9VIRU|nr:MAG: hypothetical protein LCDPAC02_03160 [Pithovirus LCDPAC02]